MNAADRISYLSTAQAHAVHVRLMHDLAEPYSGLRDARLLDSALARPRNAAAHEKADVIRQAAHLMWGVIANHPFRNGNKRTGIALAAIFLDRNGYLLDAPAHEVIAIGSRIDGSAQAMGVDEVESWLRGYCEALG